MLMQRRLLRAFSGGLVTVVLAAGLAVYVAALDPSSSVSWTGPLPSTLLVLSILPGIALALAGIAVTRRPLLSFLAVAGLYAGFYRASTLKELHLGVPLMPQDLKVLSPSSVELLTNYVDVGAPGVTSLMVVLVLVLVIVLARFEPPIMGRGLRGRLATLCLAVLVSAVWWSQVDPDPQRLQKAGFEFEVWSPQRSAEASGLVNTFAVFSRIRATSQRLKDDPAETVAFLSRVMPLVTHRQGSSGERPDIVVVQSEALFDPSLLRGMQDYPFFPGLKDRGVWVHSGDLHVPAYGGGTIRTEFEVLTGIALRSFPEVMYPYLELDLDSVPSVVAALGDSGYQTFALHPNSADFWRRGGAFRAFGFNASVWKDGFSSEVEYDGPYPSDKSLVDEVVALLSRPLTDPAFVFAITIQNHGPYLWHSNLDKGALARYPVPPGLSETAALELRTYLYHLEVGAEQLYRLIDFLNGRSRPAILLVYGDHLPALPNVFEEAGLRSDASHVAAPSKWFCIQIAVSEGCPPDGATKASWQLSGVITDVGGAGSDPFYALKRAMPPEIARLTQSPQAGPPGGPAEWASYLEQGTRNMDVSRLTGVWSSRLQRYTSNAISGDRNAAELPILVSPAAFGRYVSEQYEVTGIAKSFHPGGRLFATAEFSGYGDTGRIGFRVRDRRGKVIKETTRPGVLLKGSAVRINFDLGLANYPPGEYLGEVVIGDIVASTSSFGVSSSRHAMQ